VTELLTVLAIVVGAFCCMTSTCVFTLWLVREPLLNYWPWRAQQHHWTHALAYALWPSAFLALIGLTLIFLGLLRLAYI
jgi:hypothetical protein